VLFYAFTVLLPRIEDEPDWSASQAAACFSGALLISALVGIPVGKVIDRHGPRLVMTTGSGLGVLAALAIAGAPNLPAFAAAWALAGLAMAATFYLPAFAALIRWYGERRVWALTTLTLAGGFSSLIFAPLTAVFADAWGWRGAYVALAIVLAVVTIPLHWFALAAPWPDPPAPTPGELAAPSPPVVTFVLLATALTLSALGVHGVLVAVVPLLEERGMDPTTAAWALGLGGLGQTLGRLLYGRLSRHLGVTPRTVALIGAGGVTTLALGVVSGPALLLVVLSMLAGMVRGNLTLLQATAVPDRWGHTNYGHRSAVLSAPVTVATALAPFLVTFAAARFGSYPEVFVLLAAVSGVAAALALVTGPRR
jgi:MFS family permease